MLSLLWVLRGMEGGGGEDEKEGEGFAHLPRGNMQAPTKSIPDRCLTVPDHYHCFTASTSVRMVDLSNARPTMHCRVGS